MDAEALKIILSLKEENIILHRTIVDALVMLNKRKKHFTFKTDNQDASWLIQEVHNILSDFDKIQQPTQQSDNAGNGI